MGSEAGPEAAEGAQGKKPTGAGAGFEGTVSGSLQIRGKAIDVRVRGTDVSADLQLDVAVPRGDLGARRLELGGSRLQLTQVRVPGGGKNWWADLRVKSGSVQMPREGSVTESAVDAEIEANLADSRPILALVVERRKSFRWLERLLTFENLDLRGTFRTRGNGVEMRDLRVHDRASEGVDKNLQILGQMRFSERGYDALLRASMKVKIKNVAAGLRVRNGKVEDIDMLHSLEWYQKQSEQFWR